MSLARARLTRNENPQNVIVFTSARGTIDVSAELFRDDLEEVPDSVECVATLKRVDEHVRVEREN